MVTFIPIIGWFFFISKKYRNQKALFFQNIFLSSACLINYFLLFVINQFISPDIQLLMNIFYIIIGFGYVLAFVWGFIGLKKDRAFILPFLKPFFYYLYI